MRNAALKRRCMPWLALVCVIGLNFNLVTRADAPEASAQIQKFTTEELHTLVAPIALYPDALLAQLLPATAFPIQIVDAYRFIQSGGNADTVPQTNTWDGSVIALLHYPTVLKKLNDDLKWTEQLGLAATYQMDDVSQAIQQVRAEARAAKNLVSNDKQVVQSDNGVIQIEPANPEVIYVPEYDPYAIYEQPLDDPFIWGTGYPYGLWLGNSWDWNHHHIWMNNYWGGGRWNRSSRPNYWRAPYRAVPNWYSRNSSHSNVGNRVSPRAFSSNKTTQNSGTRPAANAIQPRSNVASSPTHTTPRSFDPSRALLDNADLKNRGIQSHLESTRGQNSRTISRPMAPAARVAPHVAPRVQQARPSAAPRPSFHEGSNANRGTVSRQSSRGAASRSSGGGGSARHR